MQRRAWRGKGSSGSAVSDLLPYLPVVVAVAGLLAYWLRLRLVRHVFDRRGTRAAVEMAHALRPTARLPQLPRRRRPDDQDHDAA